MYRIPLLPKWVLTNKLPAFYDMESGTAIEQTAKIYGAMQGMIKDYEKFAEEFNKTFEEYVTGLNSDHECFQNSITKLVHDYIAMLDEKVKMQDKEISDAVAYMKENLSSSITQVVAEMKELGELDQAILDSINGIGTRVVNLETELTNINNSLDTLDETDSIHNTRLTTLEINVAEIQENEETTSERIVGLESKQTELESKQTELDTKQTELETNLSNIPGITEIANVIYPVGSIYMSVNNVEPSTLFGGTWERWGKGKAIVGVNEDDSDFATVEKTIGEKTHTLSIEELPSHNHAQYYGTELFVDSGGLGESSAGNSSSFGGAISGKINMTSNTGNNHPFNIIQPSITCYMWKRIS